jgi:replicative DNA helicase
VRVQVEEETGTIGRVPPNSRDAERAVLGALLVDPHRMDEVSEFLSSDSFYDRRHQLVFHALDAIYRRNHPIDIVVLGEQLRADGAYQQIGGAEFLTDLADAVTSSALLRHHAQIVADAAKLRALIRTGTQMVARAYETPVEAQAVQTLVEESEQTVYELGREGTVQHAEPIQRALHETFERLDARSGKGEMPGIPTGFYELDKMLCGLNSGELIVIAARPSMGKTAFALNLLEHAALSRPQCLEGRAPSVLMFSLEMGRQSLVSRLLCARAGVPGHFLRRGNLSVDDRNDLVRAADDLRGAKIFIDDSAGLTVAAVRSRARRLAAREGVDLVLIDYLQLLTHPRSESRQQEISTISRSLKELSRELGVPVVALSQLSRAVESRDPPRPQLADLRESGSIEQDADVVLLLYRPEYYAKYRTDENKDVAEVIVAKQRNGPTGDVRLYFRSETMRFQNPEPTGIEVVSI